MVGAGHVAKDVVAVAQRGALKEEDGEGVVVGHVAGSAAAAAAGVELVEAGQAERGEVALEAGDFFLVVEEGSVDGEDAEGGAAA